MNKGILITESELRTKISTGERVVVDFFATWCGPCARFSPIFEEFAKGLTEGENETSAFKLDVDEGPALCEELGVSSVPTVIIFEKSRAQKKHIGAFASVNELKKWINE
ncbi:MAG: thioredoxin family protein [Christensenellaceae bacterium]|jgi:thioredoxin 1|nr:thioredoxin family protein [Christensenellaceae bacterium]